MELFLRYNGYLQTLVTLLLVSQLWINLLSPVYGLLNTEKECIQFIAVEEEVVKEKKIVRTSNLFINLSTLGTNLLPIRDYASEFADLNPSFHPEITTPPPERFFV